MQKPEWLKALSEKASHGKARYATMLVPFAGDWVYSDFIPSDDLRKGRIAFTLAAGAARTGGLVAGVLTGNPLYSTPYWGFTFGEEAYNGLSNLFKHMDEKEEKKRAKQKLQDAENWKHMDVTCG